MQALRLADGDRTFLVANLHCTSYAADRRLADAELLRAAWFAVSEAQPEDVVVLAGDFNVTAESSPTLRSLAGDGVGVLAGGARVSTRSSSAARRRRPCGAGPTSSGCTTGAFCRIMRRWRSTEARK